MGNNLLEQIGKVLSYENFCKSDTLNESMKVWIYPHENELALKNNDDCFEQVWAIIEQECGGDVERLRDYLSKEKGEPVSNSELTDHVMDLVDDYFNGDVQIMKGKKFVKDITAFSDSIRKADYWKTVEDVIRKLAGTEVDDPNENVWTKILKVI